MIQTSDYKNIILFSDAELACPETGMVVLADGFEYSLTTLREDFGRPMKVNSCCRSAAHNKKIGGHPHSLHVWDENYYGLDGTAAIDIATPNVSYAKDLLLMALERGWSVGVGKGFLHLDRRDYAKLPQGIFGYA